MDDLFDHAARNTTRFRIEKGVPIASDKSRERRGKVDKPDFPFRHMQVNDSFCASLDDVHYQLSLIELQNMVSGAASQFSKNSNLAPAPKFTTRQMKGDTVRCWRIR